MRFCNKRANFSKYILSGKIVYNTVGKLIWKQDMHYGTNHWPRVSNVSGLLPSIINLLDGASADHPHKSNQIYRWSPPDHSSDSRCLFCSESKIGCRTFSIIALQRSCETIDGNSKVTSIGGSPVKGITSSLYPCWQLFRLHNMQMVRTGGGSVRVICQYIHGVNVTCARILLQ